MQDLYLYSKFNVGRIVSYETGVATRKANKKTGNFGGLSIVSCLS